MKVDSKKKVKSIKITLSLYFIQIKVDNKKKQVNSIKNTLALHLNLIQWNYNYLGTFYLNKDKFFLLLDLKDTEIPVMYFIL